MDVEIQRALLSASSLPDDDLGRKISEYQEILSVIVGRSNADAAKAFIDHMVSPEVSLATFRQLLRAFSQALIKLDAESHKQVSQYALIQIQPRLISFQEQDLPHSHKSGEQQPQSHVSGEPSEARCYHTATVVGERIVFIGGMKDGRLFNDVHIFDTLSKKWVLPKVLGTQPGPLCGHSAVLLNKERILLFGGTSVPLDMIWFLEVDTPFVRQQKLLLGKDVVAWSKGVLGNMPQPVVICGPSGVGKGTLITRLMKEFPDTFGFSVSHTTRLPREKETGGVHYHFTDRKAMELAIQEGKFLESADVHGNLYGTSIAAVEAVADAGKRCILDIDVQGAQAVKKSGLNALFIFIAPPSLEQLESRLRGRGTETEEQIQKRLRNAKKELEQGHDSSLFDYYLVNDDLEECYMTIKKVLGLNSVDANGIQHKHDFLGELKHTTGHSASLIGQSVYIFGGISDGRFTKKLTVIDVTNLAGGAPGRTTGLTCSIQESIQELDVEKENGHHTNSLL